MHPVLVAAFLRVLDRLPRDVDGAVEEAAAFLTRSGNHPDLNAVREPSPATAGAMPGSNAEFLRTLGLAMRCLTRDDAAAFRAAADRLAEEFGAAAVRLMWEDPNDAYEDAMARVGAYEEIAGAAGLALALPFHVGDRVRSRQSGRSGRIEMLDQDVPLTDLPERVLVRWQDTFEDWVSIGALDFTGVRTEQ